MRNAELVADRLVVQSTETENEETENCLGTEGGGEKIRVSIGDGHLDRESEAGRAASERRIAKTKARAERG